MKRMPRKIPEGVSRMVSKFQGGVRVFLMGFHNSLKDVLERFKRCRGRSVEFQ